MPDTPSHPQAALFLKALERNAHVIRRNLDGVGHEQSLVSVPGGHSHLNWLVGHLVASRDGILRALGHETVWEREFGRRYVRGSSPDAPDDALPLAGLMAAFERSQTLLEEALPGAGERFADDDGKVGDRIEFLVWHDSYHCGQTALYRRMAGLEGTLG